MSDSDGGEIVWARITNPRERGYGEGFLINELGNTFASESSVSDSDGGEKEETR